MAREPKKKKRADKAIDAKGHKRKVFSIGVGVTLLVALLWFANVFEILELKSVNWRFDLRGPRQPQLEAAIVAFDDDSYNGWLDPKTGSSRYMPDRYPWPRDFYGRVIDNLKEAGAAYIAFDVVYSESSKRDPAQDMAFAAAAKRAGNVVFAERHVPKENGSIKTETLIPPLDKAKLDKGHINTIKALDGYLRSYPPLYFNSAREPDPDKVSLDIALLRQIRYGKAVPAAYDPAENTVRVGDVAIPLDGGGSLVINYAGPPKTFPHYPFHDVYYKTMDMSVFKGKVVYIGATTEILHDNHPTPFSSASSPMPGVETHAHCLDTMLTGLFIRQASAWNELLIILAFGILVSAMTFRVRAALGAAATLALASAYVALVIYLFVDRAVILPLVAPFSSMFLSFTGIAVIRGFAEEKRARETRQLFSRYVSKSIVEEILKDPNMVKLGGEEKETTILFSDVRGFTAMSERLSAPEVVEVLNEYLTAMVDIVIANNGTLDKYVGDAIMAVWGSPLPDPQQIPNAVRTAVQMMEKLEELKAKWRAEGKPELDIGIGVNSGRVVAGNMGHPDFKMDYTVIGDDVNLAARMESANKEMNSHVLITGTTYEGCKDLVDVIQHPPIKVKGKEKPVDVIEVTGWKGQGRAPWARPLH